MLFLAIDANFRLRLKARGIQDPELGSGWAYFVEESEYAAHLQRNMKDKDVRQSYVLSPYITDRLYSCRAVAQLSEPSTTPTLNFQKDTPSLASVLLYALDTTSCSQMGWVICIMANGMFFSKHISS
jgi:hypothetical protein